MRSKTPHKKKRKRLGRGTASGQGKTAGRGQKGQMSRSGPVKGAGFEGGQTPFIRRIPKRGFTSPFRKEYAVINLDDLAELNETHVTPEKLVKLGRFNRFGAGLKVLGRGELTTALTIEAHRFSKQAKEKIEKAGGKAVRLASGKAGKKENK